jgi:hypothetical protein
VGRTQGIEGLGRAGPRVRTLKKPALKKPGFFQWVFWFFSKATLKKPEGFGFFQKFRAFESQCYKIFEFFLKPFFKCARGYKNTVCKRL